MNSVAIVYAAYSSSHGSGEAQATKPSVDMLVAISRIIKAFLTAIGS